MTSSIKQFLVLATALVPFVPGLVQAQTNDDFQNAWTQLKTLAGTWERQTDRAEGATQPVESVVSYHVTASSSVVFEEFIGDTPEGVRDMATAYHLDVDELVATHYCGAGNQPRMRATAWNPETKVLRFDFWDVTHLPDPDAYYTTNIELIFHDDDHVDLRFRGTTAGVEGDWQTNRLNRLTSRPFERATDEP